MFTLNWELRGCMHELREQGRLNVLITLMLHANLRGRCWPRMKLIAQETGYALEAVNKAKKWLMAHGAIILVPYDKRVGQECDLPQRQHIYQLTGALVVGGKTYEYLYMSESDRADFNASIGEISTSEISIVETKGISSIEGKSSKGSDDADASQDELPNWNECKAAFLETGWIGEGRINRFLRMNFAVATEKSDGKWALGNLNTPLWPDQIRNFKTWYYSDAGGGMDAEIKMPIEPETFKDWATKYQKYLELQTDEKSTPDQTYWSGQSRQEIIDQLKEQTPT